MAMNDWIVKKRDGGELTEAEIRAFVQGVTDGSIPDYQISALLMAIYFRGMTEAETTALTLAMRDSGDRVDLSSIPGIKVDKHSSGGVGDKCTLIVAPLVATLGIPVAKLSGRGLGFTGGTIDKLESIEGFNTQLSEEQFLNQVKEIGLVVAGQTADLAPADKKLYALRDVTGTVDSIPLIAASIMSKKLAGGADRILLDVTCGSGAFMKTKEDAMKLAETMVRIGNLSGHPVKAIISSMEEPLGYAIGNALEVQEAYESLSGRGPADVAHVCCSLAAGMLELAGIGSYETCYENAMGLLQGGRALSTFFALIMAQGGRLGQGGPKLPPPAAHQVPVLAEESGYVTRLTADIIGRASMVLGAGRMTKEESIDPAAGLVLKKKCGDRVEKGDVLAVFHTNRPEKLEEAKSLFLEAVGIEPQCREGLGSLEELILGTVG